MHRMKYLAQHDMYKMKCKIAFNEMIRTVCIHYDAYNKMQCMTIKRIDASKEMYITICIDIMQSVVQNNMDRTMTIYQMHRNRSYGLICLELMHRMKIIDKENNAD